MAQNKMKAAWGTSAFVKTQNGCAKKVFSYLKKSLTALFIIYNEETTLKKSVFFIITGGHSDKKSSTAGVAVTAVTRLDLHLL